MANKWMARLNKLDTAIKSEKPTVNVLRSPSPSINWSFGGKHGLPAGFSLMLYGPPKGGKSVLARFFAGWLQQQDPEALVIIFDTEMKHEEATSDPDGRDISNEVYGMDPERTKVYETNDPIEIFDRISNEIKADCQEGAPYRLIIIDSVSNIDGVRTHEKNSMKSNPIGDHAYTVQRGWKQILTTIRRHYIGVIAVEQVRSDMDEYSRMRSGVEYKAQAGFGLKHLIEYWARVEKVVSKEQRQDVFGNLQLNEEMKDLVGKGEKTGVKFKFTMTDGSFGVDGRTGMYTMDYRQGIVNQWEELAELGLYRKLVQKTGNTYSLNGKSFVGKSKYYQGVRDSAELQQWIWDQLVLQDREGIEPKTNESEKEEDENE